MERIICAAHPVDDFDDKTAALLGEAAGARVICVNPRRPTLEGMVDELEAARRRAGVARWTFWGMSGGGWLGQLYAHRYPDALDGLIVESCCACFRLRLADPTCLISPFHPLWQAKLAARGLLAAGSHDEVGDPARTEWIEVPEVGAVFRRRGGPALLVSPMPASPVLRDTMPLLWAADTRAALPHLRLPTLVVCGSADPVVPVAHARAVHEAIAGSRFVVVEGAGHVPVTEKRPEVAAAVRAWIG
jgi:3-oxoadipate enol-lactonase